MNTEHNQHRRRLDAFNHKITKPVTETSKPILFTSKQTNCICCCRSREKQNLKLLKVLKLTNQFSQYKVHQVLSAFLNTLQKE